MGEIKVLYFKDPVELLEKYNRTPAPPKTEATEEEGQQHKVIFDPTSSYTLEDLKPNTLYCFQQLLTQIWGWASSYPQ